MAKRKPDPAEPGDDAAESDGFGLEAALAELERVARDLDDGTLGLDESLVRFERGVALLRRCHAALDAAEQKIALLTGFDAEGNPVTAPFDATATADQAAAGRRKRRPDPDPPASDGRGLFS